MSSGNGFFAASSWLIQKGISTWSRLTRDRHRSPPATTDKEEECSSTQKEFIITRGTRNIQPSTSGVSYSVTPHWPRGPSELTHQGRPYRERTYIRLNKPPSTSSQGSLGRSRPKQVRGELRTDGESVPKFWNMFQSSDYRNSTFHIRIEKPSALLRQAASRQHFFSLTSTQKASSLDTRSPVRDLRYQSSSRTPTERSISLLCLLSNPTEDKVILSAPKRCPSPFPMPLTTRSHLQDLAASSIGTIQPALYKKQGPLFLTSKSSGAIFGRLNLKVKYDFDRSDFVVRLIEVEDLPSLSEGGFSQPYVRLELVPPVDNRKRQTDTYFDKDDSLIEETFKFPVAFDDLQCKTLSLQILDKDRFSRNDVMGEVKIPIPDIDLSSELEIWAEISKAKKPMDEFQEALISINYLPSAKRLTVILLKTRNLYVLDGNSSPEPFAVISLIVGGKVKKKKKTPRKKDSNESSWNEAVTFDLTTYSISKVAIEIKVFYHNRKLFGHHFLVGSCLIGPNEKETDREHWCGALNSPNKTITMWHILR